MFERYVALGDSSTEGLDDPDGRGGYRGWSDRLGERIARAQGSLLYANLAVRGRTAREVREEQLEQGLALRPDLAWGRRHLLPWLIRHARGRSSGDGREPKRPDLQPIAIPGPKSSAGRV